MNARHGLPRGPGPAWELFAGLLLGQIFTGPRIDDHVAPLASFVVLVWLFRTRRGFVLGIGVAVGLVGGLRSTHIVNQARNWTHGDTVANVQIERRVGPEVHEVWVGESGRAVRARVSGLADSLRHGARITADLRTWLPEYRRNFDDRDTWRASLGRGVVLRGRVRRWQVEAHGTSVWTTRVRQAMSAWLVETCGGTGSAGGFWAAILVGDREAIGDGAWRRFQRLGLAHLLALSGFHAGLLTALMGGLLRVRTHPERQWVLLAVLVLWMLVAGATPSLLRTVGMVAWAVTGRRVGRGASLIDGLALVGVLELTVWPWHVAALGWWLSYSATASILMIAPAVRSRRAWSQAMLVSGAAQSATLPWTLSAFGTLVWVSPVANLIVAPAFALLATAGTVALVLAALLPTFAPALGSLVSLATHALGALLVLCDKLAPAPWGHPGLHGFSWTMALGIVCLLCVPTRPVAWRWRLAGTAVLVALAHVPLLMEPSRVWFALDVGQGDATALRDHGHWLVVDTGGAWEGDDAGRRTVLPFLARRNASDVDLVLTHGHLDHIGGAASLLRSGRVGRLWMAASDSAESWAKRLAEFGAQVRWISRGDTVRVGRSALACLWPPLETGDLGANDRSVVLSLGTELLLTGDAEWEAEAHLEASAATVLKVAHHGGNTGTGVDFLAATRPRLAVVSCGRQNRYGHPKLQTLNRLSLWGTRVLRTDQCGAIRIEWRPEGVRVRTVRGVP